MKEFFNNTKEKATAKAKELFAKRKNLKGKVLAGTILTTFTVVLAVSTVVVFAKSEARNSNIEQAAVYGSAKITELEAEYARGLEAQPQVAEAVEVAEVAEAVENAEADAAAEEAFNEYSDSETYEAQWSEDEYYDDWTDYVEPAAYPVNTDYYTASQLRFNGVIYSGGWRWTYYSQRVLPGGGLRIPGRHVDENGYVCDGNGRICLASSVLGYGTIVSTPFGKEGCVYDSGCNADTLDVYTNF